MTVLDLETPTVLWILYCVHKSVKALIEQLETSKFYKYFVQLTAADQVHAYFPKEDKSNRVVVNTML